MNRVLFFIATLFISFPVLANGTGTPQNPTQTAPTNPVGVLDVSIMSDPETHAFVFMADPDFAFEVEILDKDDKMLGWAEAGEWVQGKVTISLGHLFAEAASAMIYADGQSSRMVLSPQNPRFTVISNSTESAPQTGGESGRGE
jgi:hypothetical protein